MTALAFRSGADLGLSRLSVAVLSAALTAAAVPAAAAGSPLADLRADLDRDGRVSFRGPGDGRGEALWRARRGAIVLPNLDDDAGRCGALARPTTSDEELAACSDASDRVVNGRADARDLAPLRTAAWRRAPEGATATLSLRGAGARRARLFVRRAGRWVAGGAALSLTSAEIRSGAVLALEATDIVRDRRAWGGDIDVALETAGADRRAVDRVRLRVAPLLVQPETLPTERLLVSPNRRLRRLLFVESHNGAMGAAPVDEATRARLDATLRSVAGPLTWDFEGPPGQRRSERRFLADVDAAARASGLPRAERLDTGGDIWTQDIFEPGFAAMPGRGGRPHVLRLLARAPNAVSFGGTLIRRGGGRAVFTQLRGPGVGGVQEIDPANADPALPAFTIGRDTLNSTGNFTAVPPYAAAGRRFPRGRLLLGSTPGNRPDPAFERMLTSQRAQPPVRLDTSWLEIGHVDEFTAFLPAPTRRGWKLVVADPRLAYRLLRGAARRGHGGSKLLVGQQRVDIDPAIPAARPVRLVAGVRSIRATLADSGLRAANTRAARAIDANLRTLRRELRLRPAEIVRLPVLFETLKTNIRGGVAAWLPTALNGVYLRRGVFVAPRQHGPRVEGRDLFERAIRRALRPLGITVHFAETSPHASGAGAGGGDVHCATNTLRDLTSVGAWWRAVRSPKRR